MPLSSASPASRRGFLGGVVLSLTTAVARKQSVTQMSIGVVEGALFTGDADETRKIGLFTHVVVMSAIVIGGVYGLLFLLLDVAPGNAWWYGALFGVAHGGIGGVVVGAAPKTHPRMGGAGVTPAMASGSDIHCPIPRTTTEARPPLFTVGHPLYGTVVALTDTPLAR